MAIKNSGAMPLKEVRQIIERHRKMKSQKQTWEQSWQLIAQYVRTMKQNFQSQHTPGAFVTEEVFDSTAPRANHIHASALQAMLFPSADRSFRFAAPDDAGDSYDTKACKEWLEYATTQARRACDNNAGGLSLAINEHFNDIGSIGTCGISTLRNYDAEDAHAVPIKYRVVDVKQACIAEGPDGRVDTVYIETRKSIRQLVQEYGLDNISPKSREAFNKDRLDDTVTCLHAIEPRKERIMGELASDMMPWKSAHIEIEHEFCIENGGFDELPIAVSRYQKAPNEVYGRSPAFEAMPDIMEANGWGELGIQAGEKILEPPLAMIDDSAGGNATLDASAGALNIRAFDSWMRDANRPLVEPIVTIPPNALQVTNERQEKLEAKIEKAWHIPAIMGVMDITKRLTLGEANLVDDVRMKLLLGIFIRQMLELLLPLVERTAKILLEIGWLGVVQGTAEEIEMLRLGIQPMYIPEPVLERIVTGRDFIKVVFISPAARVMKTEQILGMQRSLDYALTLANVRPDIMDNYNMDNVARITQEYLGAPSEILTSPQERDELRQARAEQQQAMMELQARQMQADIAKSETQAMHSAAKAQKESAA